MSTGDYLSEETIKSLFNRCYLTIHAVMHPFPAGQPLIDFVLSELLKQQILALDSGADNLELVDEFVRKITTIQKESSIRMCKGEYIDESGDKYIFKRDGSPAGHYTIKIGNHIQTTIQKQKILSKIF